MGNFIRNLGLQQGKKGPLGGLEGFHKNPNPALRLGLGFRVWGLGFRVWGLGFVLFFFKLLLGFGV